MTRNGTWPLRFCHQFLHFREEFPHVFDSGHAVAAAAAAVVAAAAVAADFAAAAAAAAAVAVAVAVGFAATAVVRVSTAVDENRWCCW